MTTSEEHQNPSTTTTATTTTGTTEATRKVAETYFSAWQAGDADVLRAILADDATFRGPLGTADSGDECVEGLMGMRRMMERVEVKVMVADGDDVITFFDLHTSVADPAPAANWTHVEDGVIRSIRVTFDPRGILAAAKPSDD